MKSGSRFVGLNFSWNVPLANDDGCTIELKHSQLTTIIFTGCVRIEFNSYIVLRSESAVFTCKSKLTDNSIVNHKVQMKHTPANIVHKDSKYLRLTFFQKKTKLHIKLQFLRIRFANLLPVCTMYMHTRTCLLRQIWIHFFLLVKFICLFTSATSSACLFTFCIIYVRFQPKFVCLSLFFLCVCVCFSKEILRCFVLVHKRYVPLHAKIWYNKQSGSGYLSMQKWHTVFNLPKMHNISQWVTHNRIKESEASWTKVFIFYGLFMMFPVILLFQNVHVCLCALCFVVMQSFSQYTYTRHGNFAADLFLFEIETIDVQNGRW